MTKQYRTHRLDDDLFVELVELRKISGVPIAEMVRRAIRQYIDQVKGLDRGNSQSVQVSDLSNRRADG